MAARRDQDTALHARRPDRGRHPAPTAAAGRITGPAGFAANAAIGRRCHELRLRDQDAYWRILYRIDPDAILILEVFQKTTRHTPAAVIETCKRRLRALDELGE
jgi:hypothetical protein